MTIRVVVADDHTLVRQGICTLIDTAGDIRVVGQAVDGAAAVAMVADLRPDVLVTDIGMPVLNGIQATERLRELGEATAVVILSMHNEDTLVRRALQAGARGYVLKDSVTEELIMAIRAAGGGGTYLSPAISATLLAAPAPPAGDAAGAERAAALTAREIEVLEMIGTGATNRAIASRLGISVKTVERHRTQLMAKLDAHNVVDLVRAALKLGIIQWGD